MYRKLNNTLYHGTVSEIKQVDVSLGRGRKDFGKGFYMAVSKGQAVGMMHKKYREAIRRNRNKLDVVFQERLYEINLDTELLSQYNVKKFDSADIEWLDFILDCREKGGLPHDYDVVIGPTADDDTALCLKAYWDGLYGKVGSQAAKNTLLNNLETENLGIQYFIGNQDVANAIITNITEINWR